MNYENEEVCYINYPSKTPLILEGTILTAQNIWKDKDYWIQKVFEHYRTVGFPYPEMTKSELFESLGKLRDKDPKEVLNDRGEIKNSGSLGLDICRSTNPSYWDCKGPKTPSIMNAFYDDKLLLKVLKNRMGYASSKTDWEERGKWYKAGAYYLFDMSDDMLIQGFRSSAIGFSPSNFKPMVAKFLISRYCEGDRVLDPSIGWSARYLAANSLGKVYYGIDPAAVTANTADLAHKLGDTKSRFYRGGSEEPRMYQTIPEVDYVIVCPPYLDLEIYSGGSQSIESYSQYDEWLNKYWTPTVSNCVSKLRRGGRFTLIMIESYQGKELLKDMASIMENLGLKELERLPYQTSRSHLTKKAGNTKNNEVCVTMEKL